MFVIEIYIYKFSSNNTNLSKHETKHTKTRVKNEYAQIRLQIKLDMIPYTRLSIEDNTGVML